MGMRKFVESWPIVFFVLLALYPVFPSFDEHLFNFTHRSIGDQMPGLFIFAILALGLNIVVGYTGLLHLGIAAFFGIGAYTVGILTIPGYSFQINAWLAIPLAGLVAALAGFALSLPTLRLRGDYLALVTLGFGEVVRSVIKNMTGITRGADGLSPVPAPRIPGVNWNWHENYQFFYYLTLITLIFVFWMLYRLERSKLGRAWVAIREDELAATCMGINANRLKLAAMTLAAGLAGLAGGLYACKMTTTAGPDAYDFNKSVFALCCVILGGLGSRNGVLLGVFLLYGYDNILSPVIDGWIQNWQSARVRDNPDVSLRLEVYQQFSGWRLIIFGVVLILVMRFRPAGLLPNDRIKEELKHRS
jgi:branched-chain amino acid transport system permease protein